MRERRQRPRRPGRRRASRSRRNRTQAPRARTGCPDRPVPASASLPAIVSASVATAVCRPEPASRRNRTSLPHSRPPGDRLSGPPTRRPVASSRDSVLTPTYPWAACTESKLSRLEFVSSRPAGRTSDEETQQDAEHGTDHGHRVGEQHDLLRCHHSNDTSGPRPSVHTRNRKLIASRTFTGAVSLRSTGWR